MDCSKFTAAVTPLRDVWNFSSLGKAFVSWRLLGTESNDLAFNLYRTTGSKTVKLNKQPLTAATHFIDEAFDTTKANTYTVKAVEKGKEQKADKGVTLNPGSKSYLSIAFSAS